VKFLAQKLIYVRIQKAIETSGLTEEELAGNAQYLRLNKKYSAMRLLIRHRGVLAGTVNDYRSTFEIARVYFWEGNRPMAKVYADSAISFLEKKLSGMIDDHRIYSTLGVCYAISGHEKKAIEYGRKAMELFPTSLDAWIGPIHEGRMAEIYIILGKYDLALDKIERLLSIPSHISTCEMLVEPMYEPLRNLPRFKKLVEKYKYTG
jgi:tetratricopeptide (TPR) repeat protein